MSSIKRKLAAQNARAIDQTHAESIELKFKKNGRRDPDRSDVTVLAVLQYGEAERESLGGGRTKDWSSSSSGEVATLFVDRTKYSNLALQTNDLIRAIDDPRKPMFEIANIAHTAARWVLTLRHAQ